MNMLRVALFSVLAFLVDGCTSSRLPQATSDTFSFALIGDMPYLAADSLRFERLMADINADPSLAWVVHVGDIKTGGASCSDAYLERRRDWLGRFEHPFMLTPGDNEWTDCHRSTAGGYAPLERLATLRRLFYPEPGRTLGRPAMRVLPQSDDARFQEFVENVMWERGGVVFATLHVVGSRNGRMSFAGRTAADDAEADRRTEAAVAWLRRVFETAREGEARAIFLAMHADAGFERYATGGADPAFRPVLEALDRALGGFDRPVFLAHGDSHYFRIDKPMVDARTGRRWTQFTRVETFGASDVHWLRVTVDPSDENVFSIRQEIVMP